MCTHFAFFQNEFAKHQIFPVHGSEHRGRKRSQWFSRYQLALFCYCFYFFFNFRNLSERDCFCLDALGRLLYWVYLTGQCLVPGVKTSLPLSCLRRPGRALESRPGGWLAHLLLPVLFCFFPPCCGVEGSKGRSHLSSHWRGKLYLPAWRGLLGCPHWPWFTFPGEAVPVWIRSFRTLGAHRWKRRHHPWPFPSQGPVYWLHWNL